MSENRFFNRELSWLEFNARVLHQGLRKELPLLERLQFLSIVTSNFDEFFQVRVASVKRTFFDKPDFIVSYINNCRQTGKINSLVKQYIEEGKL